MATLMKKQKAPLGYLEQVRQHLTRLPSIDPETRTILLTGFPNVGKSSFINKITRADVEVCDYAFTTQSLYVGHLDYNYLRWQVIDSPGVLDRPLEDRNTIEMQAITALAHLNACVIFMLDLDPGCKWSIQKQCHLFRTLKPLYAKKPVLVVCNKTDLRKVKDLSEDEQKEIKSLDSDPNITIMDMSNNTEDNVMKVRNKACEVLMAHRMNIKSRTNKVNNIAHRIFIAKPEVRDRKTRPTNIPESVLRRRANKIKNATMDLDNNNTNIQTEKDIQEESGGHGVYNIDLRKFWNLKDSNHKYDAMPEIWNGKNIVDFVDTDISEKLKELELEETEIEAELERQHEQDQLNAGEIDKLSDGEEIIFDEIQYQKEKKQNFHSNIVKRNHAMRPREIRERTLGGMEEHLEDLGYDLKTFSERASRVRDEAKEKANRRGRSVTKAIEESRARSKTRDARSKSRVKAPGKGLSTIAATIASRNILFKSLRKLGKRGNIQVSSDRFIGNLRPKHLLTGKRGIGKT
eukprot:UN06892